MAGNTGVSDVPEPDLTLPQMLLLSDLADGSLWHHEVRGADRIAANSLVKKGLASWTGRLLSITSSGQQWFDGRDVDATL